MSWTQQEHWTIFHISSFGEQISTQGETSIRYLFKIQFLFLWDTQDHKMNFTIHAPTLPFSTSISLLRLPQLHILCPHSRIFGWRLRNDRISIYCFSVFDMSCREPAKYFYLADFCKGEGGAPDSAQEKFHQKTGFFVKGGGGYPPISARYYLADFFGQGGTKKTKQICIMKVLMGTIPLGASREGNSLLVVMYLN